MQKNFHMNKNENNNLNYIKKEPSNQENFQNAN
jgi:hypothetical protein